MKVANSTSPLQNRATGLARAEQMVRDAGDLSPNAADKLAAASRTYHQLERLALGESTDRSEVTVIGDGSAERFAAALDRFAARLAQKGPELPQR